MHSAKNSTSAVSGTLYLVATPIGNLEDITYRAVRILKEADVVFCEDTRRTLGLLKHLRIERPTGVDSFHDHSSPKILERVKTLLREGKSVAYVTDGGMPVVSDPGFVLVRAAHQVGAPVSVVPGPSAAVTLFAASGLPSPKYFFHGFFPRTRGEVERTVEVIRANPVVHIFYEAPGRIKTSLEILSRNLPEAQSVLGRELTKVHEEILHGSLAEIFTRLEDREKVKGECVLAVMGGDMGAAKSAAAAAESASGQAPEAPLRQSIDVAAQVAELTEEQKTEITTLVKSGVSSKDAAKELSKKFKMPRRVIYEFIIRYLT